MNCPISPAALASPMTLAVVINVDDPDGRGRAEVELHSFAGSDSQAGSVWARVAQPVAGRDYGTVFFPDVGDEVLVAFIDNDTSYPVIVGSLYHGNAQPGEAPVESGAVKRWGVIGHQGTKAIIDESASPEITLETPSGVRVNLTDSGTEISLEAGGSSITIGPSGISLETGGQVSIDGSTINASAGSVSVTAGISDFSGVVNCNTLISTTVVSSTYTPGAGNIW